MNSYVKSDAVMNTVASKQQGFRFGCRAFFVNIISSMIIQIVK